MAWKRLWARKYSPYFCSCFIFAFCDGQFGPAGNKLFLPEGNLVASYFDEDEFAGLVRHFTAQMLDQDMAEYARHYEQRFIDFLNWCKECADNDFDAFSNQQLADFADRLSAEIIDFCSYQFMAFLALEGPVKSVEETLGSNPQGEKLLQAISTPYKHTVIGESRFELLEMVKNALVNEENLAAYVQKYAWLPIYDFSDEPLTVEQVKEQIALITDPQREMDEIRRHQEEGVQNYREYLGSLEEGHFKKLVEITHYFSYLKEMRDDYRRHGYYLLLPFWEVVGKRLDMSRAEANLYIHSELSNQLRGTNVIPKEKVEQRVRGFSLVLKDGVLSVYAQDLSSQFLPHDHETELKGMVANRGKVTGRVNVIFHQGEFANFQEGSVLVTTMTHPEFLPIMKKAIAIITDEGGITSHAAIVARELGKPCIIGTKRATRTLKTGDLVEVDAEQGVVIVK